MSSKNSSDLDADSCGPYFTTEKLQEKSVQISQALDDVIKHFNDLRVKFILENSDKSSKKLEDLLETFWEPLSIQILQFQTHWNMAVAEVTINKNMQDKDMSKSTNDDSTVSEMDNDDFPPPPDTETDSDEYKLNESSIDQPTFQDDVINIFNDIQPEPKISPKIITDEVVDIHPTVEIKIEEARPEYQKFIFKNFIKSEHLYHGMLICLNMFCSAISNYNDDVNAGILVEACRIFSKINEILKFHSTWLDILDSKTDTSEEFDTLLSFLVALKSMIITYKIHAQNHSQSLEVIQKFRNTRSLSDLIPKVIMTGDTKMLFEEALARPISRMTEYYNLINDILSKLSETDPKYELISDLHAEITIFFEVIKMNPKDKKIQRSLVKWTPCVEYLGEGARKHRILAIITDYILCFGESSKSSFSHKWHCSFKDLILSDDYTEAQTKGVDFTPVPKVHIDELKEEVLKIKRELNALDVKKNPKKVEKIEKLYHEKTADLVLKFSSSPLKLSFPDNKSSLILFVNDKTSRSWHKLLKIRKNSELIERRAIYIGEINNFIDSITKKYQISYNCVLSNSFLSNENSNKGGSVNSKLLTGKLYMSINFKRNETAPTDAVFCVEIDKHVKGYKACVKNSKSGIINNDIFTFDLDNCEGYVYVACTKAKSKFGDQTGVFVINLSNEEIVKRGFIRKKKDFKWGDALIFIEFTTSNEPRIIRNFNALNPSIKSITECEGSQIPSIIQYSLDYIEKNGLNEVGIYRISGVSSKIAQLHQQWQEGWITTPQDIEGIEVHTIASNFKQFFRQLNTPLIPPEIVSQLVALNYRSATYEDFSQVLSKLDPINKNIFIIILNHLILVERYKDNNKMTFQNLATVFGVNILKHNVGGGSVSSENVDMSSQISVFAHILEFWKRYTCPE